MSSSARRISSRSACSTLLPATCTGRLRSSGITRSVIQIFRTSSSSIFFPRSSTIMLSTTLRSSRTFPGQLVLLQNAPSPRR